MPEANPRKRISRPRLVPLAVGALYVASFWAARSAFAQGDVLYGALIMATNSAHPATPPAELNGQAENLKTVFGYNEFRVLGEKRKTVTTQSEDWLVPSREFFLRVDTERPVPGGYALGLKLLRENRVLVEAEWKLNRNQPLFIRGPFVGQGQLLILLMVL